MYETNRHRFHEAMGQRFVKTVTKCLMNGFIIDSLSSNFKDTTTFCQGNIAYIRFFT